MENWYSRVFSGLVKQELRAYQTARPIDQNIFRIIIAVFTSDFIGILSPILYLLLKIIVTGIAGVKKIFQDHDKNQCNHLHGGRKILEGRNNFSLGLHAEISVQVVLESS